MKSLKIPRKLSLVKFDFEGLPKKYHKKYPFTKKGVYLFLGEIENMPGYCIIATTQGKISFGWHTDNFKELTEDEMYI